MKSKFIWFMVAVAILAFGSMSLADWSTAQHDFQRTGLNPVTSIDQQRMTKLWTYLHPTNSMYFCEPSELNDRVFASFNELFGGTALLEALDINTGAVLWSSPLAGGGSAPRSTPTAVTVDTTGSGDMADLVYVGSGAGGLGSIQCFRAADGSLKFTATAGGRVRYSQVAVVDTNTDGVHDIAVFGTEAGTMRAVNAVTGAFAWDATLDAGYWVFFGPSVSTDQKVLYAGTYDIISSGTGKAHAVDAVTGAILGTFDPATEGSPTAPLAAFTAPIMYIDDNTVLALAYGTSAPNNLVYCLDRDLDYLGRSGNNGAMFAGGSFIVEPGFGDSLIWVPSEELDLIIARYIPNIRITGPTLVNLYGTAGLPSNGVATSANGIGLVTDQNASMYVSDHTEVGSLGTYWTKSMLASLAFPGFNLAGVIVTDDTNDSGVVAVLSGSYAEVHAFRNSPTPRARWAGPAELFMNIPTELGGVDVETLTISNIGDGAGSYGISLAGAAGSIQGKNVTSIKLKAHDVSPARKAKAERIGDDLVVTSSNKFMSKELEKTGGKLLMADLMPTLPLRSVYNMKDKSNLTAGSAASCGWNTFVDLSGGSAAAGADALLEVTANSAALTFGTYFCSLEMTVAPDDPDPDLYGGTDLSIPITLVVGFVEELAYCGASDAALMFGNFGRMGTFPPDGTNGFITSFGTNNEYFTGSLVLQAGGAGGCLFFVNNDTAGHYLPKGVISNGSFDPTALAMNAPNASAYLTEVDICSTLFATNNALPGKECCSLSVQMYAIGLYDGAFCDSVITIKYVVENIGSNTCDLNVAQFIDWDVGAVTDNRVLGDEDHGVIWTSSDPTPVHAFGLLRIPSSDQTVVAAEVDNPTFLYPTGGHNWVTGELDSLLNLAAWDLVGTGAPDDKSSLLTTQGLSLAPGEKHLEEYVVFGWDNTHIDFAVDSLRLRIMKVWLRQQGYLRGDVNTDNRGHERSTAGVDLGPAMNGGKINVVDVVYLANYILNGTARPYPFDDQGDVNADASLSLADVIALANYVFKGTNIPTDTNRFLPLGYQAAFSRTSIYEDLDWR